MMKSISNAGIRAIIGASLASIVGMIAFAQSYDELMVFVIIGAIIGLAIKGPTPKKVITLRDMQNAIERGKYDTFPVARWKREPHGKEGGFYYCSHDGSLFQRPEEYCPNPYHPNLPPRASSPSFLYFVVGSVCLALVYSIINNEALVTLIVTFSLLIVSVIVFTILFAVAIYISAKVAPSQAERRKDARFASLLLSFLSAVFAMIIVSFWLGQFPSLTWWIIEFAIAYMLEELLSSLLAVRIYDRYGTPLQAL